MMAEQNWWYKAKYAHKGICFSLIGSEGPSTWTLLTLAAVDFHQEGIDQTFDELVTRYSNGKGKAKKWENLRQPFDTLWPLMKADFVAAQFQKKTGHDGGLKSAALREQSASDADKRVQEGTSENAPKVTGKKPWDDELHNKKAIFPIWLEFFNWYHAFWPKQIQASNFLDFEKAVGKNKDRAVNESRATEVRNWVINRFSGSTDEEGIYFPDLMKVFADGAMPPFQNQPGLEVGGDDYDVDFEQPKQPVARADYDDEEDFG